MKLMSRLLCLCLCGLLLLSACGREQTAGESRPESSVREVSSEEASVEESASEATSIEEESAPEKSSVEEESSVEASSKVEESSVEESSSEVPEEPSEEAPARDLIPVQTDSPVDAYYTDVPRPDITLEQIPAYNGSIDITLNDDKPFLEGDEMEEVQILLTPLDALGRAGCVMMLAGPETLPTAKRRSISSIHPSGFVQAEYPELINESGGKLYQRAHMLMFAFSGLNATEENLITGTHMMNAIGMQGDETSVLEYIRNTGHHVLYRCTPFFAEDELVARGVLVEALSLEDDVISFCTYCYNVEPGVEIDYKTGESHLSEEAVQALEETQEAEEPEESEEITRSAEGTSGARTYICNTNTKKFHYPDCKSVKQMKEKNKLERSCTREELINEGYDPCGNCNP